MQHVQLVVITTTGKLNAESNVKESLEKTISNQRLSVLQWETSAAEVWNAINDLPLALGNIVSDFENMDLITTN